MKRAKKIHPQKTSKVDTNYDCRQGNKWDHQLGCEFQSSRYLNLCLKGALIITSNRCDAADLPLLIYLIYTRRACGARVASVRLTDAREKRIYCNRQSLFGLLEQIDSFGNLKRKA